MRYRTFVNWNGQMSMVICKGLPKKAYLHMAADRKKESMQFHC